MNIFVIATASRASGALSIYSQFIEALSVQPTTDKYYIFVDPSMPQPALPNVRYVPVETRGVRRVWFDFWGFKRIVKQINIAPQLILSFQNTGVRYPKVSQIVYFHNIIPLHNKLWNPFRKVSRTLFFYASLYPYYIRMLINKRMNVVVQADFIKPMFVEKFKFPPEQVHVMRPRIGTTELKENLEASPFTPNSINLIYPASGFDYKNHQILINALDKLMRTEKEKAQQIVLHLTLERGENRPLEQRIEGLGLTKNIMFHGQVSTSQLSSWYEHAHALVFPSWLETLGLPLVEAAAYGLPIIACDAQYAKEALNGYQGVSFAKPDKAEEWAKSISEACNKRIKYPLYKCTDKAGHSAWDKLFDLIHKQ